MRKTLLIMAVALLLTQCRKPAVEFPTAGPANIVSMTIIVGPGGKTDISETGAITWSSGDKIYVGYDGKYVGRLTLQSGAGSVTGMFSGDVTLPDGTEGEQTFHFFYLGSVDHTGSLKKGESTTVDVDFSSQNIYADTDSKLANASKHHVGYGTAKGTVSGGVVTGINVTMVSKVALARFSFKKGSADYTEALTLSGDNIYNDMTVNFGGTFEGKTKGSISLGAVSEGISERYVMLVPTGATTEQTLTFTGSSDEGEGKVPGLVSNKFYGKTDAIAVTLTVPSYLPGEFTVSSGVTVKFSRGNLYYNGADDSHKMNQDLPSGWNFYGHQWDCYPSGTSSVTASMEINLFTWGYGTWSTVYNTMTYQSGYTMKDWGSVAIGSDPAGTWRTLSMAEWEYLRDTRTASTIGSTPNARYAEVKVNGVCGLMLFPDTFTWPSDVTTKPSTFNTNSSTWNNVDYGTDDFGKLESSGAVFLPTAGYRKDGTAVEDVGLGGDYWSSTPHSDLAYAPRMCFSSSSVNTYSNGRRKNGASVRLVR